jgi:hypothetical protein
VSIASPSATDLATGVQKYVSQMDKHSYLMSGIRLPNPPPNDLVEPLLNFIGQYDLQNISSIRCGTSRRVKSFLESLLLLSSPMAVYGE